MCAERAHARGAVPVGSRGVTAPHRSLRYSSRDAGGRTREGAGSARRCRGNSAPCRARAALRAREGERACAGRGGGEGAASRSRVGGGGGMLRSGRGWEFGQMTRAWSLRVKHEWEVCLTHNMCPLSSPPRKVPIGHVRRSVSTQGIHLCAAQVPAQTSASGRGTTVE